MDSEKPRNMKAAGILTCVICGLLFFGFLYLKEQLGYVFVGPFGFLALIGFFCGLALLYHDSSKRNMALLTF